MSSHEYYEHDRPEILEIVPANAARVLDVGCGSGRLGEQIKRRQGATVYGIEIVREAAARAAARLDRVWNAPVEAALAEIPDESFDCIITADVLEHLVDPWAVLAQLRARLVPGGVLVASIPNVGHWEVVRGLLEGKWQYTSDGLLDRTHLRFFTRRSIPELFWTAGLRIRELSEILGGTAMPGAVAAALRQAGLRVAPSLREGKAFQYRVVAERPPPLVTSPRVGIVVVSRGEQDGPIQCLTSIQRLDYEPADTLVVDLLSTDGFRDEIRTKFPEVMLLDTDRDLGSAEGTNAGIRQMLQSPVEYLLILRSDTIVAPTLLTRLIETATVTPEAGLWGPRAYYHSRPDTVWATGFRWDPQMLDFVIQGQGDFAGSRDIVHQVDALAGCATLVRRDVFEQIGLLAPQYFSGWEEFDFCARATAHGFKCLAVPEAQIWRGSSTHDREDSGAVHDYFETRNRLLWARRHLTSRELGALRRQVAQDICSRLPALPGRAADPRRVYWWVLETARQFRQPSVRVRMRALLDHLLRRTGDCPEAVRRMK